MWCRKAAEQGDADSQCSLGVLYHFGAGVQLDYAEAARWYRKAEAQGLAKAQLKLGNMYCQGQGVRPDLRCAAEWWSKARAQGNTGASIALAAIAHAALDTRGTPVVVTGLAANPQFNGRVGIVRGPATKPGRLAVLLDGDAKPSSLRTANLRKLPPP